MSTASKPKPKTAMARLLDTIQKPEDNATDVTASEKQEVKNPDLEVGFKRLFGDPKVENKKEEVSSSVIPVLKDLNTSDCIPWKYADRPEDEMGDLDLLAQSIKEYGQQEPILARPSKSGHGKYEIIFGHRRWKACKLVDKPILAIVKEVSNKEAALFQKEENENREDLSDFSRAQSYRQLLEEGIFTSENELSKYLGIRRQTLNDIFAYIRVPEELRILIPKFKNLSRNLVVKLATLSKNKDNLESLKLLAPKIELGKITGSNVDKELGKMRSDSPVIRESGSVSEIPHPQSGKTVLKIKYSNSGVMNINISKEFAHQISQESLVKNIGQLLGLEL